jgi:hypothetical protein
VEKLIKRKVETVLDPALLVETDCFERITADKRVPYSNYILYYSLDGYDKRNRNVDELRELAKKTGKQIIVLTPEWPKKIGDFINVIDAGPLEFLALIKNADIVCTNSFHGTALSIAFQKDFYVLEQADAVDDRKSNILNQLGLLDRMISGQEKISNLDIKKIDYERVGAILEEMRNQSRILLNSALGRS